MRISIVSPDLPLQRLTETLERIVWLNPMPERSWGYTQSIGLVRKIIGNRMHPLTIAGLEAAMKYLSR
jgi:uncharacterized protein with von Willebrand factor type A (vWA) domain